MASQNGIRWRVDVTVTPSARIRVIVGRGYARVDLDIFRRPSAALDAIATALEGWRERDEIVLTLRSPTERMTGWSTLSRAAALYWCATMLGKCWPPRFVPLIERRANDDFIVDPPLLERRAATLAHA